MFSWFGKKKGTENILNSAGGMRLEDAEVDILFIIKNNDISYINQVCGHLFATDDDGDESLKGRVVNFVFTGESGTIEVFVAFAEDDAYTMFIMRAGMQERLDSVSRSIFQHFAKSNAGNPFSFTDSYSTQYIYAFKLFRKNSKYFMVNNAQTQAYLIDMDGIQRENVGKIKQQFWG